MTPAVLKQENDSQREFTSYPKRFRLPKRENERDVANQILPKSQVGRMKAKSVIGVILVLVCSCLSLGNGDQLYQKARKDLRTRYSRLSTLLKHPDILLPLGTIRQHLRDIADKKRQAQTWIQKISGYSHEQLSNQPESFKNKSVLKLATEYHLLKAGWYHVRFTTLKRAAERDDEVDLRPQQTDYWPSIYKCRRFALKAVVHSRYHMRKYIQCYKALSEKERQDLMTEIKFPKYILSQELNHESPDNEESVESLMQNHKYAKSDDILKIQMQLDHEITRLLKRKSLVNLCAAPARRSIRNLLTPERMKLNENMMSNLCNCFSITDLSQHPDKASRSDLQFLEVAWLFNRYGSLWHEIRYIQLLKFLLQGAKGLRHMSIQRIKNAIKAENESIQHYALLYKEHYKVLNKYEPVKIVIACNNAPAAASEEIDSLIDISADESLERMQWSGTRKRTVLKRFRNTILQGTFEMEENQPLDENEKSLLNEPLNSEVVAREVNSDEEDVHRATRGKFHQVYVRRKPNQAEQRKSLDGQPDCSTADQQTSVLMDEIQDNTIAFAADLDLDLPLSASLRQAETCPLDENFYQSFRQQGELERLITHNEPARPASEIPDSSPTLGVSK